MKLLLLSALVLPLVLACSQAPAPATPLPLASSGCEPNMAVLTIGDGYLQRICGCQEPDGVTVASAAGGVTCTVQQGAVVFFHFQGTVLDHQLVAKAGSSEDFLASQINRPRADQVVLVHVFYPPPRAATYEFVDTFDSGLNGKIIVQ